MRRPLLGGSPGLDEVCEDVEGHGHVGILDGSAGLLDDGYAEPPASVDRLVLGASRALAEGRRNVLPGLRLQDDVVLEPDVADVVHAGLARLDGSETGLLEHPLDVRLDAGALSLVRVRHRPGWSR